MHSSSPQQRAGRARDWVPPARSQIHALRARESLRAPI